MSINLLFTNPSEPLKKMSVDTWNVVVDSGGGNVAIEAGANIDVSLNGPNDFTVSTTLPVPNVGNNGQILGVVGGNYEFINNTPAGSILPGLNIDISQNGNETTISTVNDPTFSGTVDIQELNVLGTLSCEDIVIGTYGFDVPTVSGTILSFNGSVMQWIPNTADGVQTVLGSKNIDISGTAQDPIIQLKEEVDISGDFICNGDGTFRNGCNIKTLIIDGKTFPNNPSTGTYLNYNGTSYNWASITEGGSIIPGTNIDVSQNGNDFTISVVNNPTFIGDVYCQTELTVGGTLDCNDIVIGTYGFDVPTVSGTILSFNGSVMQWIPNDVDGVQTVSGSINVNIVGTAENPVIELTDTIQVGTVWANGYQINSFPDNTNPITLPVLNDGSYPPNGYVLASNGTGGTSFIENVVDGVQTVYPGINIDITGTAQDPVVDLADIISLQEVQAYNIKIKSQPSNTKPVSLPQLSDVEYPPNGYVLASNGNGTTSFIENTADGVQSVSAGSNIDVSGTINPIVSLADTITLNTIVIDGPNSQIQTNNNPVGAGITSGDHLKTSTVLSNDLFITSKLTTGGTYPSYKLPEITDDQNIGTNLIMKTSVADINNNNALQFVPLGDFFAIDQDISATSTGGNIVQLNINATGRSANNVLAVNPSNSGLNWIPMGSGMDSQTVYQLFNNAQVQQNPTIFNMAIVCTLWTSGLKTMQFHFAQNYTANSNYAPILMGVDPASGFYPQFADTPGTAPSCLTYLSGDNVSFTDFPTTYGVQSAGSIDIGGSSIVLDPSVQIGVSPIFRLNSTPEMLGYCQIVLTPTGILFNFLEKESHNPSFASLQVPANDKVGFGYLDGEPSTFSCTYY